MFDVWSASQQHASVFQGRICSDNLTCCHTETEVVDQTFYLTRSQYTDTGQTSPGTNPITPGAWQDSHWSANFEVTGKTRLRENPIQRKREPNPGSPALEVDALTTRPTMRCVERQQDRRPYLGRQGVITVHIRRGDSWCAVSLGPA